MWPEDAFSLPARDGYDVGGAQERAMADRVDGYGGIRETYEVNPDGSVTTLRTRLGWPAFETTGAQSAASTTIPERGFVAKVPGGRAVLFNPYTMAVLKSPYLPASNSYSVQDFGTSWNVAPSDTTHWYDVALFDGSTIKVNSKAMPSLRITANHGFPAITYVINRDTADDQYGNAERNATEKRVFAVGRHSVKSWGGGGVVDTLSPTTPRTDDKALTLGQRIDGASDSAWLGQFYFTGAAWDSSGGSWAFSSRQVTMLLAAGYLSGAHSAATVDMPLAALGAPASTSGTSDVARSIPDAIMELVGTSEVNTNYYGSIPLGTWWVRFPWTGYTTGHVDGKEYNSFSLDTYTGSVSATSVQSGVTLTYACANTFTHRASTGHVHIDDTIHYTDGYLNPTPIGLDRYGVLPDAIYYGPFQTNVIGVPATTFPNFSWTKDTTTITFQIDTPTERLIDCSIIHEATTGQDSNLTQHNWAQYYLDNPRSGWGVGSGYNTSGQGFQLEGEWIPSTTNPAFYPQMAIYQTIADTFNGLTLNSYLDDSANYAGFTRYDHTLVTRAAGAKTLNWTTKDFLLFDEINGAYITVEASFAGSGTTATLTVLVRVKTRHHEVTIAVGAWGFTFSDMLPTREIGSTGRFAVPAPQVRAIWTPLHQEQGSFKGAHYVTLAEESNGATPFHGFNFLLYLRPYSSISTCNADNETGQPVYFVPCNLLEMLYAFVFSSEYGVALSGERYPVTHSANFTALMTTLFSNPIRVSVKNGVAGAWTDALGSDFASVSTVSLHRA